MNPTNNIVFLMWQDLEAAGFEPSKYLDSNHGKPCVAHCHDCGGYTYQLYYSFKTMSKMVCSMCHQSSRITKSQ